MRGIWVLFLVFSLICIGTWSYADEPGPASENKIVGCNKELAGKLRFHVAISMKPPRVPTPEEEDVQGNPNWIRYRFAPFGEVESVQITVNNEPIYIPQSAFSDLYAINSCKVSDGSNYTLLSIVGGDAAYGYTVQFKIVGRKGKNQSYRISERVWRDGEFPKEILEKIIYYYDNKNVLPKY
jgi:hypothetical protein